MRYVAAYLLSVLGGQVAPAAADVKKILSSVGIEADGEKLKKVISELSDKCVEELMAQGREKLSSMPLGGGAAAGTQEKKEEKKEATKEESESEDKDMGFDLLD